jgi:putative iron-dependent peroxidase
MATPQLGIFGLGTAAQCYLEFDRRADTNPRGLVEAVARLEELHATLGGVSIVVGLRPRLWADVAPAHAPVGVCGFDQPIHGVEGFVMPVTQHDAWVWVSGAARDSVFDVTWDVVGGLDPLATVATEQTGWSYQHGRDLTGFIDGTENPSLAEAPDVVLVPAGEPGAGGTVVLVQQWAHDARAWSALTVEEQQRVIGRTKADSIELPDGVLPTDSHVARTVIEEDGEELPIFRRNTPYGGVTEHGTTFVGFSRDQTRLQRMLLRMAGTQDGVRDALTRYTTPLTGAYYVVPSIEALRDVGPSAQRPS